MEVSRSHAPVFIPIPEIQNLEVLTGFAHGRPTKLRLL